MGIYYKQGIWYLATPSDALEAIFSPDINWLHCRFNTNLREVVGWVNGKNNQELRNYTGAIGLSHFDFSNIEAIEDSFVSLDHFYYHLTGLDLSNVKEIYNFLSDLKEFNGRLDKVNLSNVNFIEGFLTDLPNFNRDISDIRFDKLRRALASFNNLPKWSAYSGSMELPSIETIEYCFHDNPRSRCDLGSIVAPKLKDSVYSFCEPLVIEHPQGDVHEYFPESLLRNPYLLEELEDYFLMERYYLHQNER